MNLLLALAVLASFLVYQNYAAKVAMLPNFGHSHFLVLDKLGEELQRRGHKVAIIVGSEANYAVRKPYAKVVDMNKETEATFHEHADRTILLSEDPNTSEFTKVKALINQVGRLQKILCGLILSQSDIMDEFRQADVIVGDSMFMCSSLVAGLVDRPLVVVSMASLDTPISHLYGVPAYPNYVPAMTSKLPANMGLLDRIQNMIFSFAGKNVAEMYVVDMVFGELKEKYNIRPDITTTELMATLDLPLLTKSFVLDYAQPIPPYIREVGNFMATPARPLPSEFEEFIKRSGDEGVIIVSFGSMVSSLDVHVLQQLITAFSKLQQGVIWRLDTDKLGRSLPPNIKAVNWLPQNDLLGHNKTRLFFTHGGANGLAEATYHGIPMVCSPLFGDQFDNAQIIVHAGTGEVLDVKHASAHEMIKIINRVLTEQRFKESSVRVSRIQKMRPRLPVEEAADLVEYTQAVGHLDHLKPKGMSLPFYQLYMLDVIAVLGVILIAIICIICSICKVAISYFCKTVKKTKTS